MWVSMYTYPQEMNYKESFVQPFNIAIFYFSVFSDLENDVKVQWLIWHIGLCIKGQSLGILKMMQKMM